MVRTDEYEGLMAETVMVTGAHGDWINAYLARPLGAGPFPALVLAHHMPGWDEWYRRTTLKFALHGCVAITPNLYFRAGHGTPEDVAAKVRGEGGIPDDQVVGDLAGAMQYVRTLPYSNGKVGVFGTCSGGRHAYLAACRAPGFDAVVDCWGGRVVMAPDQLNEKSPVSPLEYTKDLNCPILGIFGNEDKNPTPEQVNQHEAELKKHGKSYEFHRYDGAGHGFFYDHAPGYRQAQAVDGWQKVFAFLEKYLRP
ncbi:MAG TPA: dienelactone hydrolase family protein [Anaerolineales bacterium]|jgi:carboxymethylenebutenolidase|nr:dienelactone hydrolase family protein [Anaerolineales bacterium]